MDFFLEEEASVGQFLGIVLLWMVSEQKSFMPLWGAVDPGPLVSPPCCGGETLIQPPLQRGTIDGQTKKLMNPRSSRSL